MPRPRFEHVGLTVSDLDRMVAFFTEMLGFELKARLQPFDPGAVAGITGVGGAVVAEIAYVAKGDTTFELLQYREPAPTRSPLRHAGKFGTYLRHPDGFSLEVIGPPPR